MKAVNLLPPDLRGAGRPAPAGAAAGGDSSPAGAFALLGALAFCVVALVAYVLTTNTVKDRRVALDAVTAQADAASAQAARLKPYADFAAQAQERVQTVRDLAGSRFDWEQALRDVSRVVPAGVTLSTLNGSIAGGAGDGGTLGAIAAPSIQLVGCTTGGQVQVATLLARLRNVDGVTRVSLSKSDKPEAATGAATPATTSSPAGCGPGRPPEFAAAIYFERSTVQDSVVGTGGAAGTTPTAAGTSTAPSTGSGTAGTSGSGTTTSTPATPTSSTP